MKNGTCEHIVFFPIVFSSELEGELRKMSNE